MKTPKRGKSDADESALKARYRAGKILSRYTHAHFTEIAQTSVCNRVHTMRQRCARWLLQTHDRVGTAEFPLTQRFLSQMLGVRRATVTEAARSLQEAGLNHVRAEVAPCLDSLH